MNRDEVRKKLREALSAPPLPPLDATRRFLFSYYADMDTMAEVEKEIAEMVKINTKTLHDGLEGIEALLVAPPEEPDVLWRLVVREIGIRMTPNTDEGSKAWLKEVALVLRRHLAPDVPPPPPSLYVPGELDRP